MSRLTSVQLDAPYLILIGDVTHPGYAKTGFGIVDWRPERVAYLAERSRETGLPCVDPMRDGRGAIVRHVRREFGGAA